MDWLEQYRDVEFVDFDKPLPADLIDAHVAQVPMLSHKYGTPDAASLASLAIEADDAFFRSHENATKHSPADQSDAFSHRRNRSFCRERNLFRRPHR
jgi:hypothetical protein